LRELEAKLKAGFMNRERSAQLAEKQVMELDRKVLYYFVYYTNVPFQRNTNGDILWQ